MELKWGLVGGNANKDERLNRTFYGIEIAELDPEFKREQSS